VSPIDHTKISNLLDQICEGKNKLKILSESTKEEFLKEFKNIGSAKYNLVIVIEAMLDLSNNIVAKMKLGLPKDYADVFVVLNKENIFTKEFVVKLINLARYLNKLVHLYAEIDDEKVYNELKDNIQSFEMFEKVISNYLREEK
jgi:uncharacterized protein YutE (UPF0331/DUF86 family)